MPNKSMIVIGAGIAGLSTGCYAQMNGFKSRVYEMHTLPGGLCTAWKRKDYVFDGCIHWLVGSRTGTSANRLWQELGAVKDRPVVNHDFYYQVEGMGKTLTFHNNIDRLENHLLDLSPEDARQIKRLCSGARSLARMDMVLDGAPSIADGLKMLPALAAMARWGKVPMPAFAHGFKDPFIRQAFLGQYEDMEQMPAMIPMMTLAWMHKQDAGYPIGGSLPLARDIEQRYLDLGGAVHYRSPVEKVLVENNRAVGVRLSDGTEQRADLIISAADGYSTIFTMLNGKYVNDTIRNYYKRWPIFPPIIQVSLGIKRDVSAMPHTVVNMLETPVTVAGKQRHQIGFRHFCCDPTIAPEGKSVVTSVFASDHAWWKKLAADRRAYEAEKQEIARIVIEQLGHRFPGIASDVEVIDVATPLTTERYTGNWQGSMEGWLITPENIRLVAGRGMGHTLPGLENFYMAGQWVEPGGGVPTAALSARKLIRKICKLDRRKFKTTLA